MANMAAAGRMPAEIARAAEMISDRRAELAKQGSDPALAASDQDVRLLGMHDGLTEALACLTMACLAVS
jgi:hypothetical protein